MAQRTKRQHHIPQMLLKYFSDETGKVFMLDSQVNKIKHQRIEKVACQNHLYSIEKGEELNDKIEREFSRIEGVVAPILSSFLECPDRGFIDDELGILIQFCMLIMMRSPMVVKMSNEWSSTEEAKKQLDKNLNNGGIIKEWAEKFHREIQRKGVFYPEFLSSYLEGAWKKVSRNFDVAFLFTEEKNEEEFILGDKYIVTDNVLKIKSFDGESMWENPIHVYFPLSGSICLHLFPRLERSRIGTNNAMLEYTPIIDVDIKRINNLTNQQRDRYLYARKKELIDMFLV